MNIYNITIGQLITLWVLGFFVWLAVVNNLDNAHDLRSIDLLFVFIPALLIFYTLGWRNNRNK